MVEAMVFSYYGNCFAKFFDSPIKIIEATVFSYYGKKNSPKVQSEK